MFVVHKCVKQKVTEFKKHWQSVTLQEIFDRTPAVSEDLVKVVPKLDHPCSIQPHLGLLGLVAWP